jgi:hypothetical protein
MASKIQTIKDIRICLINELSDIYPEPEIRAFENIIIKTVLKYPASMLWHTLRQRSPGKKPAKSS